MDDTRIDETIEESEAKIARQYKAKMTKEKEAQTLKKANEKECTNEGELEAT